MTVDQLIEWALRIVMGGVSVLVWIWGRDRATAERALERRFGEVDQAFLLRDERIATVRNAVENASAQSSKTMGKVTEKMDEIRQELSDFGNRLTRVETEYETRPQHRRDPR